VVDTEIEDAMRLVPIMNALANKWCVQLSHTEFKAAVWIINRTIRWGKGAEVIPRRHVLKGVPNSETGPAGLSYRAWLKCVRGLEREGIIQVEHTKFGLGIQVIYQRILVGPMGRT
jgi:hypothetical protein